MEESSWPLYASWGRSLYNAKTEKDPKYAPLAELQPQIEDLIENLSDHGWKLSPYYVNYFKQWPVWAWDSGYTNVLGRAYDEWSATTIIKAFTQEGTKQGRKEVKLIDTFNEFSEKTDSPVSGPGVLSVNKNPFYFKMEDLTRYGMAQLDFSQIPQEELLEIYKKYREVRDAFEKYARGLTSREWEQAKQRLLYIIKTLQEKYQNNKYLENLLNNLVKKKLFDEQKSKLQQRMAVGEARVRDVIAPDDFNLKAHSLNVLQALQTLVDKVDLQYSFGRFFGDHVFTDKDQKYIQLVDFDAVWYIVKWTEITNLMYPHLLSVENFETYDERKEWFDIWYEHLQKEVGRDLARLLVYYKLMWIMYGDFWYTMITNENNRRKLMEKWVDPETNADKWIIWINQLLADYAQSKIYEYES